MSALNTLSIGGISVRQKNELYCLNDLHKAAGGERRHEIANWTTLKTTKEEISYLEETTGIPVFKKFTGRNGGTYVNKDLVYSYAMWVSPKFKFAVIEAYDALVNGLVEEAKEIATRTILKDEYRPMTDAVLQSRLEQGKEVKHFHFSNEADLINLAVTGMKAKQFKAEHQCDSVRDNLTETGKQAMLSLQRANTSMIDMGFDREERKARLNELMQRRWSDKQLIATDSIRKID